MMNYIDPTYLKSIVDSLAVPMIVVWLLFLSVSAYFKRANIITLGHMISDLEYAISEAEQGLQMLASDVNDLGIKSEETNREVTNLSRGIAITGELTDDTRHRIIPLILQKMGLKLTPPRNGSGFILH